MYVSNAHQFLVNPVNFKRGPIIDIKKKKSISKFDFGIYFWF